MFLDVEDQVAAFVGGEEIAERARRLQQRTVFRRQNLLATAADVLRDRPVAALGDQRARGDDVLPRQFAVEAYLHHAARPQQRQQRAPALPRIAKMVQHDRYVDEIKAAADRG